MIVSHKVLEALRAEPPSMHVRMRSSRISRSGVDAFHTSDRAYLRPVLQRGAFRKVG